MNTGRKIRSLALAVATTAGLAVAPGVANATSPAACPTDYGTNFQVRVQYCGSQNGYTAEAFNIGSEFWGHIEIWGPGINRQNGPDGPRPSVRVNGFGRGDLCAQGWRRNDNGSWSSVGLPCVTIR
ncbi:MAG: hypothetical protein ABIQ18_03750 [Umezawaea sp.]